MAAAYAASRTDVVATVPAGTASELSDALRLRVFATPVRLPRIDVAQHWHERFHREPGSRWIRGVFVALFANGGDEDVQQQSA
jgi:DNA-binding transcriptional LysR family regulator